jgi:hypothetical protein
MALKVGTADSPETTQLPFGLSTNFLERKLSSVSRPVWVHFGSLASAIPALGKLLESCNFSKASKKDRDSLLVERPRKKVTW